MPRYLIPVAAVLLLLLAIPAASATINQDEGLDLLLVLEGSSVNFEGDFAIPADFFGPGSEPFTGIVPVLGVTIDADPNCQGAPAPAEIIIKRDPFVLADPPSSVQVPIEIVQLKLVSAVPITVKYQDGATEQWNFEIVPLPPPPQPPPIPPIKIIQLDRDGPNGGDFTTTYEYDMILRMTREVTPAPPPQTYTPPQPDVMGGQGRWGIPAEIPEFTMGAIAGELSCPPCKTDNFYLGFDGNSSEPFWLTGQFFNLHVINTCTGAVPVSESSWGEVKTRFSE